MALGGGIAVPMHRAAAAPNPCASKPSKWKRKQCEDLHVSAPGDEYFGRLKLSYLGVENTFHDAAIRAGAYTTDPGFMRNLGFANESLTIWAHKYPNDPELARAYFLAAQSFAKVYTQPGQKLAWYYLNTITQKFPNSYFGRLVRKDLQIGFTEHYFAPAYACGTMPPPIPAIALKKGYPKVIVLLPRCTATPMELAPSAAPSILATAPPSPSPKP